MTLIGCVVGDHQQEHEHCYEQEHHLEELDAVESSKYGEQGADANPP